MHSLVRRSLRTTAAAAGIAAVGVGLAGPAFAAPELPPLPQSPDTSGVEVADADEAMGNPVVPSQDGFFLPGVINFETPDVNTAAPELPAGDAFAVPAAPPADSIAAPEAPAGPGLPDSEDVIVFDVDQVQGPSADSLNGGQNNVGAMQALDMAALAMELAQSAAAGDTITENQQIG